MKAEIIKMDELEFRRSIYSEPSTNDESVRKEAEQDQSKQKLWDDIKTLDASIEEVMNIPVPENLAHKIILNQSLNQHQETKKRGRVHLALAASVAFAIGISFTTLNQSQPEFNLSEGALAHFYHAKEMETGDSNLSTQQVNFKLASFGTEFSSDIGKVYSANFCDVDNVRTLHLIMDGEQGKVSVFIVPHEDRFLIQDSFGDKDMDGRALKMGDHDMVIIGEKNEPLDKLQKSLLGKLNFTA
jgi:hypothetical protein